MLLLGNSFKAKQYSSQRKEPSLLDKVKTQIQVFKQGIAVLRDETQQKMKILQNGGPANRREFLLCHRNDQDISKLIPFIIMSIIIPEIIPIIILKMSHMIPSPFFSANQLMDQRVALDKARKEIAFSWINELAEKYDWDLPSLRQDINQDIALLKEIQTVSNVMKDLEWEKWRQVAKYFGLSHWGLSGTIQRDLNRYMDYLRQDEEYLIHIDFATLPLQCLEEACEARGISVVGKSRTDLEQRLTYFSSLIHKGVDNHQIVLASIVKDAIEREKVIGSERSDINEE